MSYAVRTFAEALALTAFVVGIGMLADSTLPFARPASATSLTQVAGCAEPPARTTFPHRAGRDQIADIIRGGN